MHVFHDNIIRLNVKCWFNLYLDQLFEIEMRNSPEQTAVIRNLKIRFNKFNNIIEAFV